LEILLGMLGLEENRESSENFRFRAQPARRDLLSAREPSRIGPLRPSGIIKSK
jgi:hypothetical protein